MKLSPDVRRVWRRFSFQALGWSFAGLAAWPSIPAEFRDVIGAQRAVYGLGALLLLGLIGSCIDQPKTRAPKDEK